MLHFVPKCRPCIREKKYKKRKREKEKKRKREKEKKYKKLKRFFSIVEIYV